MTGGVFPQVAGNKKRLPEWSRNPASYRRSGSRYSRLRHEPTPGWRNRWSYHAVPNFSKCQQSRRRVREGSAPGLLHRFPTCDMVRVT
jgi:hypothetical protein